MRGARHCRVPTRLSCGAVSWWKVTTDSRLAPHGGSVPRSGRQDEHLAARPQDRCFSHPATPVPHRRSAPHANASAGWSPPTRATACRSEPPTARREARSRIAPTPPTRAHDTDTPPPHDPRHRLPMAAATAMTNRHSWPPRRRAARPLAPSARKCRSLHGRRVSDHPCRGDPGCPGRSAPRPRNRSSRRG